MARKLTNAPVYFVLVQARFNPLLALDSYAPQIQEGFRKNSFPDAQKGVFATLNLNLGASIEGNAPQVPVAQTTRYSFYNMNRTSGFILDQGALSYQTTDYDVFGKFSGEFLEGLRAVHEAVQLSYTERIGFRYLDAVFPKGKESLRDYLNPSVLGLGEQVQDTTLNHSFSETSLRSADISVVARVIIQDGPVGFPPDLQPNTLPLAQRFRELQGHHAILDTDGSFQGRESFDLNRIKKHLESIHDEIAKVFRATITQTALRIWE